MLLFGFGSGAAGAQTAQECVFEGDLESYLECSAGASAGVGLDADAGAGAGVGVDADAGTESGAVAAQTAGTNTLPRTGSDIGSMVGLGGALLILGSATVYGVRQRRQSS